MTAEPDIPPELRAALLRIVRKLHGRPAQVRIALHFGSGERLSFVIDEPCPNEPNARRIERTVCRA